MTTEQSLLSEAEHKLWSLIEAYVDAKLAARNSDVENWTRDAERRDRARNDLIAEVRRSRTGGTTEGQTAPMAWIEYAGPVPEDGGAGGVVEPVAWRYRYDDGKSKWTVQKNVPIWYTPSMADVILQPLYASPPTPIAAAEPAGTPVVTEGMTWRQETEAEHIARDLKEGTFPYRSSPKMVPDIKDTWARIAEDRELDRARAKLSMHELRRIIRHAEEARAALAFSKGAQNG